jgi:4-amino-4-deoxy-L-arabinose transferase-like glycosyltransferase
MNVVFGAIGPTALALRLLPAIAGTLAIPATYLLARRLLGQRAALIAAAFLAFSHVHIHFSRTVAVSYIYATLFVPLALYFLVSAFERRSPLRAVLSVLMVALHINTYVDGWVWLVLLFLVLAAWALVDRPLFRGNGATLAMFGVALAVLVAPMVIWGLLFPAEFGSRMAVDGTFTSGWLTQEAELTGKYPALLVAELFLAALGTFTHRPFVDFYGVGVPTLDMVSAVLWAAGLTLALWHTRDRRMVVLNGWFWGGVVALGVTTVPPSTYHYRLLVVLPAAAILVGLAANRLLEAARRLAAGRMALPQSIPPGYLRAGLAAVLLATVAQSNLSTYFQTFAGACKYETTGTRQAGILGKYLHGLPRETAVFVLPQEYGFRAGPYLSVDFLSDRMPLSNIDEPLAGQRSAALAGSFQQGLLVVAVPERADELAQVELWYPGGRRMALLDCGGEVLSVYDWRPAQVGALR